MRRRVIGRGLSGRLLLLTIAFVLIGEVLIYIPSMARFYEVFLEERIANAHLATIALDMEGAAKLPPKVKARLLEDAGVVAITLYRPNANAELMLGEWRPTDLTVDLRVTSRPGMIGDALATLAAHGGRTLKVIGDAPPPSHATVEIILPERGLWEAMVDYSVRILGLSIVLSLIVASLVFLFLRLMIVRPLGRITAAMAAFRQRPEDETLDGVEPARADEIGVVERELARMQTALRAALLEKTRLAGLGAAVGRMSHDLRNLLSTAVLVSDRLEASPDPEVRSAASRLIATLDHAIDLCAQTLDYARSRPPAPAPRRVGLLELVEQVRGLLAERPEPVRWRVAVDPGLELLADPDQLSRVLLNLARNAYEAMGEQGGELRLAARAGAGGLGVTIADTGPGIPERLRPHLFEPFAGSTKPGGSGLGLAICRELMRAQGGDIELLETSPKGTTFRLHLPARAVLRVAGPRGRAVAMKPLVILLFLVAAACSWQGPSLAGYPGLQWQVMSYYNTHAVEQNAACPIPQMDAVQAKVVDENPTQVVMNVRYHWFDDSQSSDNDLFPGGGSGALGYCNDWGERTFTFTKTSQGGLQVVSMTGPQRERPLPSPVR